MSTNDLQALFANLRPKPRDSPAPADIPNLNGAAHQGPPSSSPPSFSSAGNQSSYAQQHIAQPVASTPSATAQSLLNLLNFGPSTSLPSNTNSGPSRPAENVPVSVAEYNGKLSESQILNPIPSTSASDLLARLKSPPAVSQVAVQSSSKSQDQGLGGVEPSLNNGRDASQEALLKLLNKAHPGKSEKLRQTLVEKTENRPRDSNDLKSLFATMPSSQPKSSHNPTTEEQPNAQPQPLFTYTNPFEALHVSRNGSRALTPGDRASVPQSAHADVPQQSIEDADYLPEESTARSGTAEQLAKRKILMPRLASGSRGTPVSREASIDPGFLNHATATEDAVAVEEVVAPAPLEVKQAEVAKEEIVQVHAQEAQRGESSDVDKTAGQQPDGADEWEDLDGSPNKDDARIVPVYNFPIKPFVSIQLQLPEPSDVAIRDDGVMEISRLKKDFDQLDRSLAAATSKYITYALVKNGGMRIIRQDDGSDRQVFKSSGDRIFNVTLCTTSATGVSSDDQAVLGTGISGAVYYATINKDGNDLFDKNELDSESLIFPPYPPADENTAGGVLKTRAKRSSRHPEFFAIGRGKSIHLVWPATAISPRYGVEGRNRRVDVDKFFQERSLHIATGKAGKDFTFSEDDTLIVSLDKTGRLRFWDIRKLIEESNSNAARVTGVTVESPLLSLSTASPAEKSWPTSVTFVDKVRPYTKGSALRYVLVGLRQNHTLQLWDIGLGKAVQELNFPHESETDGICSVCYHPNSGIIVVGHPTRNSLFFIHLSAPRYTLAASLSQAAYVQRIADNDPDLPTPESTACMSGIREMSFAAKGHLRSVDILPVHRTTEEQKALDERKPLFELYVVHSKGVTCLNINKEDLGWNESNKVIHGINAADEGYVSLKELRLGSVIEEGPRESSPAEEALQPTKSSKKKSGKKSATSADRSANVQAEEVDKAKALVPEPPTNGQELSIEPVAVDSLAPKETKKNKKKVAQSTEPQAADKNMPTTGQPAKTASASKNTTAGTNQEPADVNTSTPAPPTSATETKTKSGEVTVGISGDWLDKEIKKVEKAVSTEFRKELHALHQNIQSDRVVQDSTAIARQEALLRLVSTTLSNNVEKAMSRMLSAEMNQSMIPALTAATVQAVNGQVGEALAGSLHSVVPLEMRSQLPTVINAALQHPDMTRAISDTISSKISKQIESQLNSLLEKQVVPAFKSLALSAAEKAASDVEVRLRNEIHQLEKDRRNDMNRLEKLGEVLQATAATLQQMSDTQVAFQGQILKDRRQLALLEENSPATGSRQVSTARMTPSPRALPRSTLPPQKTKEEVELDEISHLMNDGHYEEASIKWLQSSQPAELFDKLFIHFTPEYLASDVSPLIAFSIAVTIGNTLNTNTAQRLEWISAAFHSVDLADPEISDLAQHAPALLSSLIQKLERLYMTIAERDPSDPALQIMPVVSRRAKEMRASLEGPASGGMF